jgi:hypothetical protein
MMRVLPHDVISSPMRICALRRIAESAEDSQGNLVSVGVKDAAAEKLRRPKETAPSERK